MMNFHPILNTLVIAFTVNLIFESGFIQSLEDFLSKSIFKSRISVKLPKPFSCDFCLVFWLSLFYLLFSSCPILYAPLISLVVAHISTLGHIIITLLVSIINLPFITLNKLITLLERWILKQ